MLFVDRVIADLEGGRSERAFPNFHPIDAFGGFMLFSVNYDKDARLNRDAWSVAARLDSFLSTFPITELERDGLTVPLTKAERKRLRKAADKAIKVHIAEYNRRKQASRYTRKD